jgi:outer membrane protein OmpA-like peptidoglycan-associated protein
MQKKIFLHLLIWPLVAFNSLAAESPDFVYDKKDKQTPYDINDDHIVVRKISSEEAKNVAVSGGNIYFIINRSEIVPTEHIKIEEIAKSLKKLTGRIAQISIEGFASKDGGEKHNFTLGQERAESVKKALIAEGLPEALMHIVSFGEGKDFQFENVNKNRRTQIRIFLKK